MQARILLPVAITLLLSACGPGVRLVPCNADADCALTEFCELGQCATGERKAPPAPPQDAGPPPPPPPPVDGGPTPIVDAGPQVPGDWLDPRWAARAFIAVDYSDPEVLTDFPVAIEIDDTFPGFAQIDPGGADLRVADVFGNPLPHELDAWSDTGGVLWTRVPRINPSAAGGVWLYFDNPSATPYASPADVFDDDTVGVYHLSDARDSARPVFEGDQSNGSPAADSVLGGAIDFDGSGDFILIGRDVPYLQGTSGATACALVKPRVIGGDVVVGLSTGESQTSSRFAIELESDGSLALLTRQADDVGSTILTSTGLIAVDTWTHVCATADLVTGEQQLLIDGELDSSAITAELAADAFPDTPSLRGAIAADDNGGSNFINGDIDEVFISRVPRSLAYLRAHHRNVTGALTSLGPVERITPEPGPNATPTVVDDSASGPEDNDLYVDVLANDTDPDGDALRVIDVTASSTADEARVSADGSIFFRPGRNDTPSESLTYTVSDGLGGTATGVVQIDITPVNDAPQINNRSITVDAGDQITRDVTITDVDDNAGFTLTVDTQATLGNAQIVNGDQVRYTAPANQGGTDTFRLRVRDSSGASDTATYTMTVNPPPPPPLDGGLPPP